MSSSWGPTDPSAAPGRAATPDLEPVTASTRESAVEPPLEPVAEPESLPACPDDMVLVDTVHCDKVSLRCLKKSLNRPNNLTICHDFAPGQECRTAPRRQRYCIDRYEYPSQKGAHPPVLVSAYDAAALCAEQGKRMCWESEWVAACEGPEKLPFPYGHQRSGKQCNIDNHWIEPSLSKVYSSNKSVQDRELRRIDQSIRSGAMETCQSGFGVFDLTGNFDEWVLTETRRGKSKWAGLKGGGWGHVRNACRPITTSHVAQFTYYFISFRCCRAAEGEAPPASEDTPPLWIPPPAPTLQRPGGMPAERGWTPDG